MLFKEFDFYEWISLDTFQTLEPLNHVGKVSELLKNQIIMTKKIRDQSKASAYDKAENILMC